MLVWPFFRWLSDIQRYPKSLRKHAPRRCWECEVLGMCRDEDNNWKCRRGCLEMSMAPDIDLDELDITPDDLIPGD